MTGLNHKELRAIIRKGCLRMYLDHGTTNNKDLIKIVNT